MNDLIALSYLRIYHIFQYNFFCTEFYIIHQSDSDVPSAFQSTTGIDILLICTPSGTVFTAFHIFHISLLLHSIPNPANNNLHTKYSLICSFHPKYVFPCSYLSISLFFDLVFLRCWFSISPFFIPQTNLSWMLPFGICSIRRFSSRTFSFWISCCTAVSTVSICFSTNFILHR